METKTQLKEFYSTSTGYLEHLNLKGIHYFEDYVNFVIKNITRKGINILDIGCGNGVSTALIEKRNPKTFGIDLSALFLAQKSDASHLMCGDALYLPFKNSQFDVVCSFEFIEHVTDVERVLDEMIRITHWNGIIIIMSPNLYSPIRPAITFFRQLMGQKVHSHWGSSRTDSLKWLFGSISRLLVKSFSKSISFDYREPTLTEEANKGGDFDSVYLSNPIDLVKYFRNRGYDILNVSIGRSFSGKMIARIFPAISTGMAISVRRRV